MAKQNDDTIGQLMLHYMRGRQDMDTRRTRKNGWNEILSAYMGKLPANWPFLSVVTDPRLRTSITEKNNRLINARLRGRLVPRNGGSVLKAKINNALLDFQWDYANDGGSMVEKVALADQYTRLFGASFALVYWNNKKNTNEIKIVDPRDISFDGAATHVRNARWVQVREFTTWDKLEERGYKVSKLREGAKKGEIGSQWRSTSYESIVKSIRGLQDRVGEVDDTKNPIVEVVTEFTPTTTYIFLPRQGMILEQGANKYHHGKIPVAMLRYHPLLDDIYGETDAEYVLPLQRAINATLCGFIDEMTISMRPPLKIASSGVRVETIEYGPGAQWVMDDPSKVQEMQFSPQVVQNFNATYPALVAAFNTAMGDQSLGISNTTGQFGQKTATEVRSLASQQNNRDQSNQLYLSEFLQDVMMMWLSNNEQFLFDDPTKTNHILKIVGQDEVRALQAMGLGDKDIPNNAMSQIQQAITANPNIPQSAIQQIVDDVSVPVHSVIMNPKEPNPENYDIRPKLDVKSPGEADLYIEPDDFDGEYDYIPDVSSMASGANMQQQEARENALQLLLNPATIQLLQAQGITPDIKDIMVKKFEDAGYTDAESMFKEVNQQPQGQPPMVPGQPQNQPPMPGQPQPQVTPNMLQSMQPNGQPTPNIQG